jgi:hypothetical protein
MNPFPEKQAAYGDRRRADHLYDYQRRAAEAA